jgi:hypothetical protein
MDDDDRRSNVAGAETGTDASPAPEPREMDGRERDLAAKTLRERDLHNDPTSPPDHTDGDVDRRP